MLSSFKRSRKPTNATNDVGDDDFDTPLPKHAHAVAATTTTVVKSAASPQIATAGGPSAAALAEVTYLTGITTSGVATNASYWGDTGETAHKWGAPTAGTAGGTVTYYFDPDSHFTATEKNTFRESFALWSSVANIQFAETTFSNADVELERGNDGSAYESDSDLSDASGKTIGSYLGQSLISIDTSVPGFDLSGSFSLVAGYGIATAFHEVGHLLGLGHGGNYDGDVDASTDQQSAYDNRMWTVMSYIDWTDTDAKYESSYPVKGTDWGYSADGYSRETPSTLMPLDILAAQRLYGVAKNTPLSGGQIFGFHTNITGLLKPFFDFTVDTQPVVTLFDIGTGNTLDLSGFSQGANISLVPGTFSSAGGLTNNIAIAFGTSVTHVITGAGRDTIVGTTGNDILTGGAGADKLTGNGGSDIFRDTAVDMNGDTITDLTSSDLIDITNAAASGFSYSFANHILRYNLGAKTATYALTVSDLAAANFGLTAVASGGVDLRVIVTTFTGLKNVADVASKTLGFGHSITFTLTTNEVVTVTGAPHLTLSNGLTATYVRGSGTKTLTFVYKVAHGNSSPDIKVVGLNTSAGKIVDVAGKAPIGAVTLDTKIAVNAPAENEPKGAKVIASALHESSARCIDSNLHSLIQAMSAAVPVSSSALTPTVAYATSDHTLAAAH